MIKREQILIGGALLLALFFITVFYRIFFYSGKAEELYATQTLREHNIRQIVHAFGTLEIKGDSKVGSLVSGVVQKIYVKKNDRVKKGQLLAQIDDGKGGTYVKEAEELLKRAQAAFEYQEQFYQRQKQLYCTGQIAQDLFEQYTQNYQQAQADVGRLKASLRQAEMELENTKLIAPASGLLVAVRIHKGERVTTDLATVLFEIAHDITKMDAKLHVSESDIGNVGEGQRVKFTVDTYPGQVFTSTITDIGYVPVHKNDALFYEATISVDNDQSLLRPGMTINARIYIGKAKGVLTISHQAFQVEEDLLKKEATRLGFTLSALSKEERKAFVKEWKIFTVKSVWVVKGKQFIEKPIALGIVDDMYCEVKGGIESGDQVVINIKEPSEMEKVYKRWFSGAL